jgi:hypothetical protein
LIDGAYCSGEAAAVASRKLRPLAAVALLAMVALISACGSKAPAATGIGSSGTNNTAINLEQAVKFSQCMRANGVSGFPDPDASGQLTIDGVVNGSSLNSNTPAFEQALSACKDLEPPGFVGRERTAPQQEAALKFAECMRANGVPDFADPTPHGPLISVNGAHRIPGFQAAKDKCSAMYSGELGLQSQ